MKNVQILDCTLRDGGRIIDCSFEDHVIIGIGKQLKAAGINIIELGFLRDKSDYNGNSTFFSSVQDANHYISEISGSCQSRDEKYVLFMDYGLYRQENLEIANMNGVSGIRYGFTKKDYLSDRDLIKKEMKEIKAKGYDLYCQAVNTNGYKKDELIDLILQQNLLRSKL